MNKELITTSNSELSRIVSLSVEDGDDTILFEFEDTNGNLTKLTLDIVGANGLRIALSALQDIPPYTLPIAKKGEYQCIYPKALYYKDDELVFNKSLGNPEPFGLYTSVGDGLITFNKTEEEVWVSFDANGTKLKTVYDKDFLSLRFDAEKSEELKLRLDEIFPFNRFGRKNKESYGYFFSNTEEGE